MKRFFPVYVRVPLIFFTCYGLLEYFIDSGDKPAIIAYPSVMLLLALVLLVIIALEIVASASNNIINQLMTPEERAEKERVESLPISQIPFVKNLLQKLTKTKPITSEKRDRVRS